MQVTRQEHVPVLLEEVLGMLAPAVGDVAVDCTAGLGGHAEAVARRIGATGTMILFDLDAGNLARAKARVEGLAGGPRVVGVHASFSEAPRELVKLGLRANVVLADLGFASNQVEAAERGLSFSREGPLDMRLDPSSPITAAELVNTLPARELAEILREFGEERLARQVAEKIVQEREREPITTTARLAAVARQVIGRRGGSSIDPATRTFQALRIAVNDELGRLASLLDSVERAAAAMASAFGGGGGGRDESGVWLARGARVAIIAFHSLEDRPVKQMFGSLAERGLVRLVTKKPVQAGDEETAANPRARSAKLRACVVGGTKED